MLKMSLIQCAVFTLSAVALHAQAPRPSTSHPVRTRGWVETRLYFGLGPVDAQQQGASEAAWRAFLDTEVTPRFPSGLSVQDIYGQWQGTPGTHVQRLRSKMLILDYPATPSNAARIEAIRAAWKQRTGDVSVLRVTEHADVSF